MSSAVASVALAGCFDKKLGDQSYMPTKINLQILCKSNKIEFLEDCMNNKWRKNIWIIKKYFQTK